MIVILNGSFGVGKTTVAKLVVSRIAGAVIYDPERWGFVLQRLPPLLLGRTAPVQDFQDLSLWSRLITRGIRRAHCDAEVVIVPMAFSDLDRLQALKVALGEGADVRTFCLVAPLNVVTERLARRAAAEGRSVSEFEQRRSRECVASHVGPRFGVQTDANRPAHLVADEIAARLAIA